MTKTWVVFALLLAVPQAMAHASPTPLDNESQLLADDVDDAYAYYDGFDLQDLYVREFYDRTTGEDGVAFRFVIFGGPGPVPVTQQFHLDLYVGAGGQEHAFRVSSSDGMTWSGDMRQLEGSVEPADDTAFGLAGALQFFVPLSALGAEFGDAIGPFRINHFADADLRDLAPGGRPIPGSNGLLVTGDEASSTVLDSYLLDGPDGYTRTELVKVGDTYTLNVQNLITVIGQHLILQLDEAPGWTIKKTDGNPKIIDPGQHPSFAFTAIPGKTAGALMFSIASDLGGHEVFTIQPPNQTTGGPGPSSAPQADEKTPGPSIVFLLAGLVALAARRK